MCYETCPHCGEENEFESVPENVFKARCKHCGEEIMLCGKCYELDGQCDWRGKCFRGETKSPTENAVESLKKKLKGVRLARKRDEEKARERLDWFMEQMAQSLKCAQSKKVAAMITYLKFLLDGIKEELIATGKISLGDWIDADDAAHKKWKNEVEKKDV